LTPDRYYLFLPLDLDSSLTLIHALPRILLSKAAFDFRSLPSFHAYRFPAFASTLAFFKCQFPAPGFFPRFHFFNFYTMQLFPFFLSLTLTCTRLPHMAGICYVMVTSRERR
jgi:hypothetical protein